MVSSFNVDYSKYYDDLYRQKDYAAECDRIEEEIRANSQSKVHKILDLGCGTGGHSYILAERGFQVCGIDQSETMLAIAKEKASKTNLPVCFFQGDIRDISLDDTYDAAIMMFAVLGYLTETNDIITALRTIRNHLNHNSLLIMDFWYGPAVLHIRPTEKVRVIERGNEQIIRHSTGDLDIYQHICNVHFHLWVIRSGHLVSETVEMHSVRYFFPQEITLLLELGGFELISINSMDDRDQRPDESTWNVLVVARAK